MDVTIEAIRNAVKIIICELYPSMHMLNEKHYTVDDLADQVVFEFIKEEYKKYETRHTIEYYLGKYDPDADHRKFTRAIQYAQHYRDVDNELIEERYGFRLDELNAQDMSGNKVFMGHEFTEQEFWGIKLEAECKLFKKLHGHQIDKSKNVSDTKLEELFEEYVELMDKIEPPVNATDLIIGRTFTLYGIESHFMIDFLYRMTLAAEKKGFPKDIPASRILTICALNPYMPATGWCPAVYWADNCMLLKWDTFCDNVFSDTDEEWLRNEALLWDCKQLKTIILQRGIEKWVEFVHRCSLEDKVNFILERYWIWDKRVFEFEWTPQRKSYFRKLHAATMRSFPKPKVK